MNFLGLLCFKFGYVISALEFDSGKISQANNSNSRIARAPFISMELLLFTLISQQHDIRRIDMEI